VERSDTHRAIASACQTRYGARYVISIRKFIATAMQQGPGRWRPDRIRSWAALKPNAWGRPTTEVSDGRSGTDSNAVTARDESWPVVRERSYARITKARAWESGVSGSLLCKYHSASVRKTMAKRRLLAAIAQRAPTLP